MCGIVGYIGKREAYPILIKGLRRLEYRGYDSAGVALINKEGTLNVYKTKGKVDNLTDYCNDKDVSGTQRSPSLLGEPQPGHHSQRHHRELRRHQSKIAAERREIPKRYRH